MSDVNPPREVVEVAARAAYEAFSDYATGGGKLYAKVAWEQASRVPCVREPWLLVARAVLAAAMAKAEEMTAAPAPKEEPIDLAKNLDDGPVRCGVGK